MSHERIEGELPDLSGHVNTGYGPWLYAEDTRGAKPIAKVNRDPNRYQDCERIPGSYLGWTRCFRMVDLPRLADECRAAGVDPEGVFVTVFDGPYVVMTWVQSEDDANKLRLKWARTKDRHSPEGRVTPERAAKGVTSPHIGEDQRAMYRTVLDAAGA